jgi:hypothetical protein
MGLEILKGALIQTSFACFLPSGRRESSASPHGTSSRLIFALWDDKRAMPMFNRSPSGRG